ncbi:MAG TPA: hypothetical protein VKZ53_16940 [Candidatus Angelobacter sp.]|nr:hypothetical protein [Candidatus Angelobacter sp.]
MRVERWRQDQVWPRSERVSYVFGTEWNCQRTHLLSAAIYRILQRDGVAPTPVLVTQEGRV